MYLIRGLYIAGGGENISSRMILHVLHKGYYIAGGGTKCLR